MNQRVVNALLGAVGGFQTARGLGLSQGKGGQSRIFQDPYGVDPQAEMAARRQGQLSLGMGLLTGQDPYESFMGSQQMYQGGLQQRYQVERQLQADALNEENRRSMIQDREERLRLAEEKAAADKLAAQATAEARAQREAEIAGMRKRLAQDDPEAATFLGEAALQQEYLKRYGYREPDKPKDRSSQFLTGPGGRIMWGDADDPNSLRTLVPGEDKPSREDKGMTEAQRREAATKAAKATYDEELAAFKAKRRDTPPKWANHWNREAARFGLEMLPGATYDFVTPGKPKGSGAAAPRVPPPAAAPAPSYSPTVRDNPATSTILRFDANGNLIGG